MGVVHLEHHLVRQLEDVVVVLFKLADGKLHAGGDEEILLF